MPRRSWQLVCGAAMALLFAALLMLWSQSDGTVEFGTSAHAAAHGESAGIASTEPVDRPAADRARAELIGLQQGSNATVTPSGTMVRVVAKATGQPLLDAEVWCDDPEFDPHTLSRSDRRRLSGLVDTLERLRLGGHRVQVQADGYVVLPSPDTTLVVGNRDDCYGQLQLQGVEPPGGWELRLAADACCTVHVVDATGSPLPEVPLGLLYESVPLGAQNGDRIAWAVGTTDSDGAFTLRHLQQIGEDQRGRMVRNLRVRIAAPGLAGVAAPVDVATHSVPVELVLRAWGSVRLRLRDADDRPLHDDDFEVQLYSRSATENEIDPPPLLRDAIDDAGECRMRYVGFAQQLGAVAWVQGSSVNAEFDGPQRHGQEVVQELRLPAQGVTLHARVVGADGPIALASLLLLVESGGEQRDSWAASDQQGRFLARFTEPLPAGSRLLIRRNDHRGHFGGQQARVPLPAAVASRGQVDLGDIRLAAAGPLANGHFVAATPTLPPHHAEVQVWGAPSTEELANGGSGNWQRAEEIALVEAEDGTFAVLGEPTTRHLRVAVDAPTCEPVEPLEFQPGAHDLQITLRAGGTVHVQALVNPSVLRRIEQVFFDLVPADGKPPQRGSTSPIDDALTVSWQGLPAGSYRLEVRAYGALGPCLSLDHLQVRSGERLDDPRLQPLDLRRVLTGMHVRLVDDGGAPVQPNEVYLYVYDGAPPHVRNDEMIGFDYGVAQLVVAGREFDVLLLGREVRPQKWRGPAADTDLHVQLPFVVTLRFRDLPTVADGNAVLAKLQRHQDVAGLAATLGLPAEFTMASIAEDTMVVVAGVVQFRVNEAGTYDVAVSCHDAQIEDISSNPGRPIGHWTVTVVRAADCEFTLHVPAAGK